LDPGLAREKAPGVLRFGDFSAFGDFAALDACGAHTQLFGSSVYQSLYGLQVYVPAAARDVVRVRNVVAKARTFAADVASLCHVPNSSFFNVFAAPEWLSEHFSSAHYRPAESSV
jgi:hypothetical protein